jgi:hypothetical protein
MNNVGELFKLLNSELCNKFYENVTQENKENIIDNMINDEELMTLMNPIMNDLDMIKIKIDTKLSSIIKKNMPKQDITIVDKNMPKQDITILDKNEIKEIESTPELICDQFEDEIGYIDKEKGKYIGSGFYLKRVDHLIKMTSPNFVVYY